MISKHRPVVVEGVNDVSAAAGAYAPEMTSPNPLHTLHRLLQGRYPYVIALAVVGAIACGMAGYMAQKPTYRSSGLIRYKPTLPRVLYQSEESNVMPMFDAFVESQAALISSQRVLDMAMQDDVWKSLGKTFPPEEQSEFRDQLSVQKKPGSTIVAVSCKDMDPRQAQMAVKTVIDAYMRIYGERDSSDEAERLQVLEQRRASLTNQLASIRSRILTIANEFGSDALEQMYQFRLQQLNELEQALAKVGISLAAAGMSLGEVGLQGDEASQNNPIERSVQEIATRDPYMRQLMDRQTALEQELRLMRMRFGDKHRKVSDLIARVRHIDQSVEDYAKVYRDSGVPVNQDDVLAGAVDTEELRARARNLQALYDQAKVEMLDLGRKKLQIDNLKLEADTVTRRLDETKFRIEQLTLESAFGGRIDVLSTGDVPRAPFEDKRKQLAVLGGGAGAMLGVAPFVLVGLMQRRVRSSYDAQAIAAEVRFLGMLPSLPNDLSDSDKAMMAGHCVHHVRTMLQLGPIRSGRRVFAVTGPASGNGKTSLTLALGLSFATAGCRTLMVDCDFTGGGLTSRMETTRRRRIGDILRRRRLIDDEELEKALKVAGVSGRFVGQTLVDLGSLSEENLAQALTLQKESSVGLGDALAGEPINLCATNMGIEHLDILPVRAGAGSDKNRVAPAAIRRVLQEARKQYDTILIDTGPMPGDAESSIAASEADGVIVVVARGNRAPEVKCTLGTLDSVGARVEGLVFNRAHGRDMARSALSSSLRSRGSSSADNGNTVRPDTAIVVRAERYGPVARAVANTVGARDEDV